MKIKNLLIGLALCVMLSPATAGIEEDLNALCSYLNDVVSERGHSVPRSTAHVRKIMMLLSTPEETSQFKRLATVMRDKEREYYEIDAQYERAKSLWYQTMHKKEEYWDKTSGKRHNAEHKKLCSEYSHLNKKSSNLLRQIISIEEILSITTTSGKEEIRRASEIKPTLIKEQKKLKRETSVARDACRNYTPPRDPSYSEKEYHRLKEEHATAGLEYRRLGKEWLRASAERSHAQQNARHALEKRNLRLLKEHC